MEQRLRHTVLNRLRMLGEQAGTADAGRLVGLARVEIRRMTEGWRGLLADHQPDENGRCLRCAGLLRNRRWPCDVWLAAHQHLVGDSAGYRPRRRPGFPRRGRTRVMPAGSLPTPRVTEVSGEQPTITSVPDLAAVTPAARGVPPVHRAGVR
ncbi:MAG TPA: hypothetical protein VGD67_20710 [Pseudonocardiaceae bacterium]